MTNVTLHLNNNEYVQLKLSPKGLSFLLQGYKGYLLGNNLYEPLYKVFLGNYVKYIPYSSITYILTDEKEDTNP